MKKKFSFSDVPEGYKLCFNSQCPQHEACIRFLAGTHLPPDTTSGPAIYPNVWTTQEGCQYFKQTRVIHGAWGFRNLYKGVKTQHAPMLKAKVTNYLGGPVASYKYMHGEKLLTPEQQEHILKMFQEQGYTEKLVFEGFTFIYDFTETNGQTASEKEKD